MSIHNICFCEETRKILWIPLLSGTVHIWRAGCTSAGEVPLERYKVLEHIVITSL